MKTFLVQYSVCDDRNGAALSDWTWREKKIQADNTREAISKFNKSHQYLGTWQVQDCFEIA